ncbi:STAS domain-containing protein [Kitasatospora sp. NPDC006697]|uniref:STAS domain-containing protein n=1 Tax=Kitasatospora sp. NPDC006697 TaxID=3364020 RepID=UPI00367F80FA
MSGSDPAPEAAQDGGLVVRVRREDGEVAVCGLAGELDLETKAPAAAAIDELIAERPAVLVVDIAGVTFCDSSGLNLLLRARTAAAGEGIDFRLAHPSPAVARVLQITGTDTVFTVLDDGDAVLRAASR